jgi:hypothetical protein
VSPISGREVTKNLVAVGLIAILYRYWLVAPVLNNLGMNPWRGVAVAVAAAIGCALSLWGVGPLVSACSSIA